LVVAIGDDQQAARAMNAPAEKPHEIKRRFVGPVQVLQHHDAEGVRRREPLEQAGEELLARQARRARGAGRGGQCRKNLGDRPQYPATESAWIRVAQCEGVRCAIWGGLPFCRGALIPMVCTKGVQDRSHETPPCHAIWSRESFLTDCRFRWTRQAPRPAWRWSRATSPTRSPGFTRT